MRYTKIHIGILLGVGLSLGCAGVPDTYANTEDPCTGSGTSIVVEGEHNLLHLCRKSRHLKSFAVAFGQAGLGKEKVGDKKTPVGTYALGEPRRSYSGFKTFIEVKVPRKMGIAVGIHGPKRWSRFLGPLNTSTNWTLGCIALARDEEIDAIADFVRTHPRAKIHIRPEES